MRLVSKKDFDTFLNYFQDKIEYYDYFRKITTYFDAFDTIALAETNQNGEHFIYD